MSYGSMLHDTCDILRVTVGTWGETSETTTAGVKCRIVHRNNVIRTDRGELVTSYATVYFLKTVTIEDGDRVFFEGRFHGIQKISRNARVKFLHHVRIWVD